METSNPLQEKVNSRPQPLVALCGALVCLIAITVITGWLLHLPVLVQIHPTLNSMKFNTALSFFLGGVGLVFISSRYKMISPILGFLVFLLGGLNLLQYVTGLDFKIDQLLFHDYLTDPSKFPGRMAPQTALCFVIFSTSLFIDRLAFRLPVVLFWRNFSGAFLLVIGLTAIFGFIFHVPFAFTWGSYNAMAVHTSIALILLGIGIMLTSSQSFYAPLIITCLIGCTLALQVYYGVLNAQNMSAEANFITDAKDRSKEIQSKFSINHQTIAALDAFFEGSQFVSRAEFASFTQTILENTSGGHIDALEWIPKVKKEEVNNVIEQAKTDGLNNFQFRELTSENERIPINDRPEYYPVVYKQPQRADDEIIGLDFSTNKERWQSMRSACESTAITSTKPLNLLRGQTDEDIPRGFLMFSPVYEKKAAGAETSQKCQDIQGFVVGVFRIKNIIEEALKPLKEIPMDVYLYDVSVDQRKELFYYHSSFLRSAKDNYGALAIDEIDHLRTLNYSEHFSDAGRNLLLIMVPTSQYARQYKTPIPATLLILILLFTFIVMMYVFSRMKRTAIIEKLVVQRTAELHEAKEKAMEVARLKSEFASTVSHELRTPLTVIKESIAIVCDGKVGALNLNQKDFLEAAKRNVDRLSRLINNVLDYQKLEAQRMELNKNLYDINELVEEVATGFKLSLDKKMLKLHLDLQRDLPPCYFDRDSMVQVLTNLMSNAVKFTAQGSVSLKTQRRGEKAVQISVQDEGIGIKQEDMNKLFISFSQISTGMARTTGGTGLGLVLCKQIVELHKGEMGVTSIFGQGSTFYFILPIKDEY